MRSLTNYPRGTSFQLLFLDALAISLSCQTDTESRLQYIIATIRGPSEIHISMQILRSKCSNCHLPDFDNSIRSCFLLYFILFYFIFCLIVAQLEHPQVNYSSTKISIRTSNWGSLENDFNSLNLTEIVLYVT